MYTLVLEQVHRWGAREIYNALNVRAHAKFGNEFSIRCHFWPFQEVLELASYYVAQCSFAMNRGGVLCSVC